MDVLLKSFFTKPDTKQFKDSKDSNELLKKDMKLGDRAHTTLENTRRNTDHVKDVNTKSPKLNEIDAALRNILLEENLASALLVIRLEHLLVCHPFMDRQIVCKNLIIDGKFISHDERENGNLGIFIDKKTIELHDNFEIEIVSLGKMGDIAIGVVQCDDHYNLLGLGDDTCEYHSDGTVHTNVRERCWEYGHSWQVGDRIRCIIRLGFNTVFLSHQKLISFTRNGTVIHEDWMPSGNYRFSIVIGYQGGMIRVTNLPAK